MNSKSVGLALFIFSQILLLGYAILLFVTGDGELDTVYVFLLIIFAIVMRIENKLDDIEERL